MAAYLYSTLMIIAGGVTLLIWAVLTKEHADWERILIVSVPIILLPIMLLFVSYQFVFHGSIILMLAGPFIEEAVKQWSSRREKSPRDGFYLVSLFGVWELVVVKPLLPYASNWQLPSATSQVMLLAVISIIPLLMHTITALIYSFYLRKRPWIQYLIGCGIHVCFNESRTVFYSRYSSVSWFLACVELLSFLFIASALSRRLWSQK